MTAKLNNAYEILSDKVAKRDFDEQYFGKVTVAAPNIQCASNASTKSFSTGIPKSSISDTKTCW